MHPALSVVFFTTATGAGYGLLALLGVLSATQFLPPDFWLGLLGIGISLGLISAGLLSSTSHLGRPERAWRAFSQWRTSWLSREGIASVVTYVPAVLFGVGWIIHGRNNGWVAATALLAAGGACVTVCTTAMIYRSLKPIAQWNNQFTLPGYFIFASMSGLTLLTALLLSLGLNEGWLPASAMIAAAVGWAWKIATWQHNDKVGQPVSANSATGLYGGTVRSVEWPHTEENYLLKEMGFRIARKHAARLRFITEITAFALPLAFIGIGILVGVPLAAGLAILAALLQFFGLLVERWLFFAEAKHSVTLYYGR